jgi:uncharacterized protein YcbK (DUF882 family)
MSNLITWTRGNSRPIATHFNAKEFTCSCGVCTHQRIEGDLIKKLEEVREIYGKPIKITSGFRCAVKQAALRKAGYETAVGISTHEEGKAADITGDDIAQLAAAVKQVFTAYGIAKTFIHVDLRPPHADGTPRTWTYSSA